MSDDLPQITVIFGKPQTGKTERSRTLTKEARRLLIYDSTGHAYQDGVVCEGLANLKAFWPRVYRRDFRIIYRPVGCTREERKAARQINPEFAAVCDLARKCRDLTFVVDEVQRFYDRDGHADDAFEDLVFRGMGHYGVNLIVTTQMPQGFGTELKACAGVWNIFFTAEPLHLSYFARRCAGVDPGDIVGLRDYQYICYVDGDDDYTICRDDLATGRTASELRRFTYDRTRDASAVADCRDVVSDESLAMQPQDSTEGLPSAQLAGDSPDGWSRGRHAAGTGSLPLERYSGPGA